VVTSVLLASYWTVVKAAGWQATFAESNVNAGLLRLRALDSSRGPSAIALGTSITAKLRPELIFECIDAEPLNMGIDGGSSLYAARKVLKSRTSPRIVLLEANLILKPPDPNVQTLEKSAKSVAFRLARYVPVLGPEYRPVAVLYSRLKLLSDKRLAADAGGAGIDELDIPIEFPVMHVPSIHEDGDMAAQWFAVIEQLQTAGIPIVLVMVPDGVDDRHAEYAFSRRLAARFNLPLIDLKTAFANRGIVYSDGSHLVRGSAEAVSRALNTVLLRNDLVASGARRQINSPASPTSACRS
jgi:hypothetical protein